MSLDSRWGEILFLNGPVTGRKIRTNQHSANVFNPGWATHQQSDQRIVYDATRHFRD
jgi:hypothetical protein